MQNINLVTRWGKTVIMIIEQFIENKKPNSSGNSVEKPVRSVLKSISWRIVGTIDTILIAWIITGQLNTAFSIGAIELVTKMLLYFFHERVWNAVTWGKK